MTTTINSAPDITVDGEISSGFIVIGDLMTDIVCQVSSTPQPGTDTNAVITTHGGGAGANVAAWLAHRGQVAHFVARAGEDSLGSIATSHLQSLGVECRVSVDPQRATGTCVVMVTSDGERTMMPDPGANAFLAPADLPEGDFKAGWHLHVSGYTLLKSGSRMAGLAALDLAKRRGMTCSVDVSSSAPLLEVGVDPFLEWSSGTNVCFANHEEAELITGHDDPNQAIAALLPHFDTVVVKLGPHGAVAGRRDGQHSTTPAVNLDVVDTTGAGDAFAAGFLIGWTAGQSLQDCLAPACVLAGRAVGAVGARP
ncbi:MAG: sugar kinase [Candidatus Nanopelagicales bacterium]